MCCAEANIVSFSGHIKQQKTAAIRRRPPAVMPTSPPSSTAGRDRARPHVAPTVVRRYRLHSRCSSKHLLIRGRHVNALAAPDDPRGLSFLLSYRHRRRHSSSLFCDLFVRGVVMVLVIFHERVKYLYNHTTSAVTGGGQNAK